MNGLLKSLLVACALVQVVSGSYPMTTTNSQSLTSLFFRSRLASQDPAISMACFSDYIEKSSQDSKLYGNEYGKCFVEVKNGRKAIEKEMDSKRVSISEGSQSVCQRLSTCNSLNTTLAIFHCHAKIGANNTKDVYRISGNSSEYANIMQEKYRVIDLRHEKCCKSAERTYVEATAVNYQALKYCLEGRLQPPPINVITNTTTTTSPTTPSSTTPTATTSVASTTTTQQPPTSEIPIASSSSQPVSEMPTEPAFAAETE